jgi:hypothetical protein
MRLHSKNDLLLNIVDMRSGVLQASSPGPIDKRLGRFCDALLAWNNLPGAARHFYGKVILESVFTLAADIEDNPEMDEVQRWAVELSLWQVISELGLDTADQVARQFIVNRIIRLEHLLEPTATAPAIHLLYLWSYLLAPRRERLTALPGPFGKDASLIVRELLDAGLPRRAKSIATKFLLPVDPLIKWNIEHRPETEELSRTAALLNKMSTPSQPVPYRVFVCGRAFQKVLSAPITSIPMAVSTSGYIHIGNSIFGGVVSPSSSQGKPFQAGQRMLH